MSRVMSQEMDRGRPLWETWMVEGLADDRWALISKVHHCMVDGVSGTDLLNVLLDSERTPAEQPAPVAEWSPGPPPTPIALVRDALVDIVRTPVRDVVAAVPALRDPSSVVQRLRDLGRGGASFVGSLRATPPTSIDGPIGAHRRWSVARATLDDVRSVKRTFGCTVNDVALAAVSGGFRELVLARGEHPEELVLRSLIPVSVRTEDAHSVPDNRVSAILFELPIGIEDPVERLHAVHTKMEELKVSHEAEFGEAFTHIAGYAPAAVTSELLRVGAAMARRFGQRMCNTVATNVPGPQVPLYALGRELIEYLPFVPLSHGVRIGTAIVSYNGAIVFGVTGDYDTAPDIGVVTHGIEDAIATLTKLAAEQTSEPAPRTRRPRQPRTQHPAGPSSTTTR
jgi:diacylglycerol O-acyltransferase